MNKSNSFNKEISILGNLDSEIDFNISVLVVLLWQMLKMHPYL